MHSFYSAYCSINIVNVRFICNDGSQNIYDSLNFKKAHDSQYKTIHMIRKDTEVFSWQEPGCILTIHPHHNLGLNSCILLTWYGPACIARLSDNTWNMYGQDITDSKIIFFWQVLNKP